MVLLFDLEQRGVLPSKTCDFFFQFSIVIFQVLNEVFVVSFGSFSFLFELLRIFSDEGGVLSDLSGELGGLDEMVCVDVDFGEILELVVELVLDVDETWDFSLEVFGLVFVLEFVRFWEDSHTVFLVDLRFSSA